MRNLVIGTAGHIDHGKSTLVLALTGTDPDRLKDEKARGITIDLGFAHWTAGDLRVAFVDVPGHERFVRNMLAGVGGIDGVLLVVAADESVMPQTREHFEICRLLGVSRGVVALTKRDAVDAETLQLVRLEVAELLEGSPLASAAVVPVSARSGEGLDDLRDALLALAGATEPRQSSGAARLPVDRAFSMRGFGTVVTGTLIAGTLHADEELTLLPGGRTVKVRGLQVHGAATDTAAAGQRVAANLGSIDVGDVVRGQTLVQPGAFDIARVVDARIELLASAKPLKHGTRVRFHQGTAETLGRVAVATPEGEPLPAAAAGFVRIRLEQPAVLTRGDRFILRAYSPPVTIGGGVVLDPQAPRGGLRSAAARTRMQRLLEPDGRVGSTDAAVELMVDERGEAGLPVASLSARIGLAPSMRAPYVAALVARGAVEDVGGVLFGRRVRERLSAALEGIVREYHAAHPLSEGLPREEARERLFAHAPGVLFERVLADLAASGGITGRERLAARGHQLALSPVEAAARATVERALEEAGLKPPDAATLAADHGIRPEVLERVLALLVRQKVLLRLDAVYFHQSALEALKQDVRALKASGETATVDVAAFKQRYGVSRKFAIPLLEYLDRERVTRRMGDARVVL